MPGTVNRARRMQVDALKSAEFESTHPPEHRSWNEFPEAVKFIHLRHWVDWDGVSRADRAALIGRHLDAYELGRLHIPGRMNSTSPSTCRN